MGVLPQQTNLIEVFKEFSIFLFFFSTLVERANRWMQQFADLELVNCETVTKKVKMVQDICDTSMSYDDDTHPQTKHAILMKGLRYI